MIVPDCILVPPDAYYYEPSSNIVFHGKGKKMQRFVFTNQKFSEFEQEKLSRLELELQKLNINPYEKHPNWSRPDLLRFCYGTGWKTRNAVKVLVNYLKWYDSVMPKGYLSLYPKAENLLNSGCLYVHGRDMYFRPIIIVDIPKFDFKKHAVQEYINLIAFFLEYIKEHMLLPGRVENWVLITDMGHQGLGASSLSNLKQVLKVLTDNYRCRLGVNYILNPPKTVYFIWSCIKPFMDDVLIEKMKIINKGFSVELLTHANPLQVEARFGGKSENLSRFWPPFVPNAPFYIENPKHLLEKPQNNAFISINPAEPSEISAGDTVFTQSKLYQDLPPEKVVRKEEVIVEAKAVAEEVVDDVHEEVEQEEDLQEKLKEKEKRRIRREKRRKRREKRQKIHKDGEEVPEVELVLVAPKEPELLEALEEVDEEQIVEVKESEEVNDIIFESVKQDTRCSFCTTRQSLKCLIF